MSPLEELVLELVKHKSETQWLEFKHNNCNHDEIGEYISALSNVAALLGRDCAYLLWGVEDTSYKIVGTSFDWHREKVRGQELESWMRNLLSDNADYKVEDVVVNGCRVVVLTVFKALGQTVKFKGVEYIRVGSYKKRLVDYPAIESQLWNKILKSEYEKMWAKQDIPKAEVLNLLDYPIYFELSEIPLPTKLDGIIRYFEEDKLIVRQDNGLYAITNIGAILFAKKMKDFPSIARKSVRVVQYSGIDRLNIKRNVIEEKGYAVGFEATINYIEGVLPSREEIEGALRKTIREYPTVAIRELVANALIHQDLSISGAGPLIELFDNRIEISNPGNSLVDTMRIIDNPPRSRNEALAGLLRRLRICEELGSGWDRAALYCEEMHLPAPRIENYSDNTRVVLRSRIPYGKMTQSDKLWTCYLHTCLRHVRNDQMTNTSLRQCFGLPTTASPDISRLIKLASKEKLIKPLEMTAPRYMRYVPIWA